MTKFRILLLTLFVFILFSCRVRYIPSNLPKGIKKVAKKTYRWNKMKSRVYKAKQVTNE